MSPIATHTIRGMVLCTLVILAIAACSSPNKQSIVNPETGRHPANWIVDHRTAYAGNPAPCAECHGMDLRGGVSGVSCFSASFNGMSCHANGPSGHPAGWADPTLHGAAAKAAPSSSAGFASCQTCHGDTFAGGRVQRSCLNTAGCHGAAVSAPHSPAPWRGGARTHTNTNMANAPVCALCHLNGLNSSVQPSPPAPAGTTPGCFNNTLCHALTAHPAGWSAPDQHGVTAEQDFAVCKVCHGATYQGGLATTTCYNCHNGPGLNHPAPAWVVPDHKTAALTDNVICQKCHGTNYLGGGSHLACISCHMENQTKVHRIAWYPDVRFNHSAYAKANGTTACSNIYCHGANLTGVALSGPSCSTCHIWPLNLANCASCHGTPPTGTVFPNIAGRHSAHTVLSTSIVCATCHQGAGSGTTLHINGTADVIIGSTYNAKTGGAALYNAAGNTCSNVSCHGGQTTPVWLTGSIDVNTQCASCHQPRATSDQYNSQYSGRHSLHASASIICVSCHDTTALAANHFTTLTTSAMEGPASLTLLNAVNYTPGATAGTGSCNPSCHAAYGVSNPQTW